MTNAEYRFTELRNQLNRGTYEGEDFFRLQVTGNGKTRWINITGRQLAAIALLLGRDED